MVVVVVVVYIFLSRQVRQIPNYDSAVLRTTFLDSFLFLILNYYYIFLILNFLTFLIRNNQHVHIEICRFIIL